MKKSPILLSGLLIIAVISLTFMSSCSKDNDKEANKPPKISSVQVSPSAAEAGATVSVSVNASDPEDQELSYSYAVTGGSISGGGSTASWIAPQQAGTYTVNVIVSDNELEAEASGILMVQAAVNQNPVINSVDANIPSPLLPGSTINYSVNASDPDGDPLSYQYQVTGGSVNPNGSNAVWTAPSQVGAHSMTITVTDGRGGQVTSNQSINVEEQETKIFGTAGFAAGTSGDLSNAKVSIYTSYDNWNNNSPLLYAPATGNGPQVSFSLQNIPPGVYYLDIWKDIDNNGFWSSGDFVGWYGSGGLGSPALTEISIAAGQALQLEIDMLIIQGKTHSGNQKVIQ